MKTKLLNALGFLRIIEDGGLSLTNIAVIIILIKVALTSQPSIAEFGALLTVISSYSFKRYHQRNSIPKIELSTNLDKAKLDSVFNDVERLKLASGFKNVTAEHTRKNF